MRNRRSLIFLKGFLGDAVMAFPAISALENHLGPVAIQTAPLVAQLLAAAGRHQQVFHSGVRERSPLRTLRRAAELRRERFDVAIVINRSFRAALIARLAAIPERIGHSCEGRRGLLTVTVPYDDDLFEAESSMDLVRVVGADGPVRPEIRRDPIGRDDLLAMLDGADIAIQPGARYPKKQVPARVWLEVIEHLQGMGHRIAFVGGPEEVSAAAELSSELPSVVNLVGKTQISQTLGLLSCLAGVVGSDTGLMHLAAAVGTPTVTVFGPTNARKWGHDYPPHRVIVAHGHDIQAADACEIVAGVESVLPVRS